MLTITLLGKPRLELDGVAIKGPRGTKSWALLARLLRSQDPVSRQRLVDELFCEADDPMGALRWTLAELRRSMGIPNALRGNPLSGDLGPDVAVDVMKVAHGALEEVPSGGRFLEGVEVRDSSTFETWLLVERRRVEGEVLGALRQSVLKALSRRDYKRAVTFASAMVQRDPLDEAAHILLVKAHASAGDTVAASAQVEAARALFVRELGIEPSSALRAAARASVAAPVPGVSPRTSAISLRSAGLAALSAGAADAGIECLRGAAAAAEGARDAALLSDCLLELGTAFVHAVRGYDDEGQVVLESAFEAAMEAGQASVAARAMTELGYVDVLFGRRLSSTQRLATARDMAEGHPELMAIVASYQGMNLYDWGKLEESEHRFREAIELSQEAGKLRRQGWALGVGSRTLYTSGDYAEAGEWASRSVEIALRERWPAFRPWAEAMCAHIDLAQGKSPEAVRAALESTFALSCQLQDACWEAISAKALAMTYGAEGNYGPGVEWLRIASRACARVTDSYRWVTMDVLVTEAEWAHEQGDLEASKSLASEVIPDVAEFSMDGLLKRATAIMRAT